MLQIANNCRTRTVSIYMTIVLQLLQFLTKWPWPTFPS